MDLELSEEQKHLQSEFKAWIKDHLVGEFVDYRGVGGSSDDFGWDVRLRWEKELAAGGWMGLTWPTEYGGRGLSVADLAVFALEYARARPPARVNTQGHDLLGPTILEYGTEEQKSRFLPPILRIEECWGQCYSEPGSGSDLASVTTQARQDGDEWVINGQKVWTSFGAHADWLYVLCRTEPGSTRHKGLTMLIIDAKAPGVEVRPIVNFTGRGEFCEVFFTDARTPAHLVLGGVDGGWRVAMGGLSIERVMPLVDEQLRFAHEVKVLAQAARKRGIFDHHARELAVLAAKGRAIRANVVRTLVSVAGGDEGAAALILVTKNFWAIEHQRLTQMAVEILGPSAQFVGDDYQLDYDQIIRMMSPAESIYGGTTEIQKNILAERVLSLPRGR